MRTLLFIGISAALLSAFALYAVSYQTRQIADANQRMEREIQKLGRDIAILRAERAFLMRAERIEPLARQLGMQPIHGRQFMLSRELKTKMHRR